MAITRFEEAKTKRYFYVKSFRKLGQMIMISMAFNILIILVMAYIFFKQPPPNYYGTNGRSNPVKLNWMSHPNYSKIALLLDEQT